jgi:ankyrin repeat protein
MIEERGYDVYEPYPGAEHGDTPIVFAIGYRQCVVVKYFVSLDPDLFDINRTYHAGWTPLHCALQACFVKKMYQEMAHEIVMMILGHPDCDATLSDDVGDTPLHIACEAYSPDIVRALLLRPGVSMFAKNVNGTTPLDKAMNIGYRKVRRYMKRVFVLQLFLVTKKISPDCVYVLRSFLW